jgi:hypothetical protein
VETRAGLDTKYRKNPFILLAIEPRSLGRPVLSLTLYYPGSHSSITVCISCDDISHPSNTHPYLHPRVWCYINASLGALLATSLHTPQQYRHTRTHSRSIQQPGHTLIVSPAVKLSPGCAYPPLAFPLVSGRRAVPWTAKW